MLSSCLLVSYASAGDPGISGEWTIDREASTAIDPWSRIDLTIEVEGDSITLTRRISAGRRFHKQVYPLQVNKTIKVKVDWWTCNRHIGAYMGDDGIERINTRWKDQGRTLCLQSHYKLRTQQGETPVRSYFEYRLSPCGKELTVIELRSSRNQPQVHVFRRP
jgi:hypothetical protein